MQLPKSTLIEQTTINSEVSIELRKMEYNGNTTYSAGKAIAGSYYPTKYNTLEDAQNDYKKLVVQQ
jgi:hypothetical protein